MRILIVDDDPQIREVLTVALVRAGYETAGVGDGLAALREARRLQPDLLVLDLGLPHLNGLEVCRRLRAEGDLPILVLTAQGDEVDRVVGLELGADDYMAKPFSPRELVARVRAILKRTGPRSGMASPTRVLRRGLIALNLEARTCRFGEASVPLTATEMALLARLMQQPDHVTGRDRLLAASHGLNTAVSDRTVDSHLRNLRRKLAEAGCSDAIETVHGMGVRMGPCRGEEPVG